MNAFSNLFEQIDQTNSTNGKVEALVAYLQLARQEDAIWAVALLSGRKPKRTVKSAEMWEWCAEITNLPKWLMDESYHVAGDQAETIALLLPEGSDTNQLSLSKIMKELSTLANKDETKRKEFVLNMWRSLNRAENFLFNKLITGGFRVGVSDKLVIRALARHYSLPENNVAHRLSGKWNPDTNNMNSMLAENEDGTDISRPYPFYLSYPLEEAPENLGDPSEWQIEYKYDGIRGQLIVRDSQIFVWSRGEELMTDKFIEFQGLRHILPNGTVIDGEILPYKEGRVLPFHVMQTRIGRKNTSKKALQDAPIIMICYDLLEQNGVDIRHLSMAERRERLEQMLKEVQALAGNIPLQISPLLHVTDWNEVKQERLNCRNMNFEGLMLKRKNSEYKTGRRRGDWWKWKVDPLSVDGVLLYAQKGHGRRADLFTDYTLAVWDGDDLVPFAKAYSGLTDNELVEIDNWIKRNTKDKFGPVRSVVPELVFEIGFEGINPSPRHRSGIALRFPRILRWRKDKPAIEANTKDDLLSLLKASQ